MIVFNSIEAQSTFVLSSITLGVEVLARLPVVNNRCFHGCDSTRHNTVAACVAAATNY